MEGKKYPSSLQKQLLIQLVEADPELRGGKFSSSFTKKEAERRWQAIAQQLNAVAGAKKSWDGWRKSWQDKKSKTKNKLAVIRRQSMLTGGGPPPEQLNEEDQLVLGTFSSAALVGHIDSNESMVEFIDLATPTSTSKVGMCMAPRATSGSRDVQDVILCDSLPGTSQYSVGAAAPRGTPGSRDVQDVILCDSLRGTSQSSVGAAAPRGTPGSRDVILCDSLPGTSQYSVSAAAPRGTPGSRDVILCDSLPGTSQSSVSAAAPRGTPGSRDVILCDSLPGTSQSSVSAAAPRGTPGSRGKTKTNAARRHQASINVAEKLSTAMEAKNLIKQKFYEDFIKLMAQQTEALASIARSMQVKSSPYI